MEGNIETIVGKRIKELRQNQGLTLRSLADQSGLSANAISLIERGENSATISSLEKIANALCISVNELFHKGRFPSILHLKSDEGLKKKVANFEIQSLGFGLQNQLMDPYRVTVFPGEDTSSRVISHPGQEFIYCLSGEIEFFIGDQRFQLYCGDSLLFDALYPHGWCNPSDQKVDLLMIFQSLSDPHLARQRHIEIIVDEKKNTY